MTGTELLDTLSLNIKSARRKRSWTQEKLAEEANLSSQAINAIEGKRRWPGEETISKIASALDVEVYQLLIPQNKTPVVIEETPENEQIREEILLEVIENLRSVLNRALDKEKSETSKAKERKKRKPEALVK